MRITKFLLLAMVLLLGVSGIAQAAIDVVQAPTGYFVPTDAQKLSSPYYRWAGDDWGWQHNAITDTITSASLSISAFDVDDGSGYYPPQIDNIYALDGATWVLLGDLDTATSQSWTYTTFTLGPQFYDEIATGLQVKMEIDVGNTGWAVTLAKSVLTTEGSTPPPPPPVGNVPEPATLLIWSVLGTLGLFWSRRR